MGLLDGLLGNVVEGGARVVAADRTNEANKRIAELDRLAQAGNQEKAINALQSTDDFANITRNAEGGFTTNQSGGQSASAARQDLAFGDIGRSQKLNELIGNFDFGSSVPEARGIVAQEDTASGQLFSDALDKQIMQMLRGTKKGGGIENTGTTRAIADASADFALKNQLGGERAAQELSLKLDEGRLGNLARQIAINQRQVPAPGFTTGGPGGTAANAIVQSPPPPGAIDLGGVILPTQIANVVNAAGNREDQRTRDEQFLLALRTLGNQNA